MMGWGEGQDCSFMSVCVTHCANKGSNRIRCVCSPFKAPPPSWSHQAFKTFCFQSHFTSCL